MGKTGKWLRSLLSSKKSPADPNAAATATAKDRKKSKWVSSKSPEFTNVEDPLASPFADGLDANKHAIAVAAATAAVAEAALAAAQAAAEVVKLTSGGGSLRSAAAYGSTDRRRVVSAIKIQSAFRAYLARRALRALKGLVKLQAHVRGHIVRKQSADMLRRMQAMARIQARASANRAYTSEFSNIKIKFPNSHHPGVADLRKYEQRSNAAKQSGSALKQYNSRSRSSNIINSDSSHIASNWLNHWMEQCKLNNRHEISPETGHCHDDKILEVDTWKPHQNNYAPTWNENTGKEYSKKFPSSRLQPKYQKPNPSVSSEEVDQVAEWTVENSPRVHSASSRPTRGPFTPMRSTECSRSLFGDYVGYPNYMANTESSQAKVRSHSAPKQRIRLDELGASLKYGTGLWESDAVSEKGSVGPPGNYRSNTNSNLGILRGQGNPNYRHAR